MPWTAIRPFLSRALRPSHTATVAALALLSGCSGVAVQLGSTPESSQAGARDAHAPPPEEAGTPERLRAAEETAIQSALRLVEAKRAHYAIGPADLLEITVYQEPDLDRKVRVTPEGSITLPLVGEVKVGGLGVADAERAVHQKLTRYVVEPHVSVFIREYGNKQVYVLGEVHKPGSYALPTEAPLTVVEAVALAGGFTQFASQNRTRVIRHREGKSETFVVEVTAVTRHGDKSRDLRLEPNDVVFVPESFF
ncbi:MAG: polysaccharide biosynthesis/export family protein [Elusimicrobia bacterium]|nr:polysaccharide biosynthesis/export family protein [Elusimicrobiota bacterium]